MIFDVAIVMASMDANPCVNYHAVKLIDIWFLISLLITIVDVVTDKGSQVEPLWELNIFINLPSIMVESHVLNDKNSRSLLDGDSLLSV